MLVKISDWAWLPLKEFPAIKLDALKDRLTIYPKKTSMHQEIDPKPIELFRQKDGHIGIPRGFFIQQNRISGVKHEIVDIRSFGRKIDLKFDGTLKDDQMKGFAAVMGDYNDNGVGGIIQATPGYGKTVLSLAIFAALKMTAVVVVQKQFLVDQWVDRIKSFIPDARIGRIQKDKCEFGDDFDISVAMLQTLSRRSGTYPAELWDAFGVLFSDEVHHVGAPGWAGLIPMFRSRYRIGLSATPRRKDGAEDVFFHHLGNILFRSKVREVVPRLRRQFTNFEPFKSRTFSLASASKEVQIRHICKNPARNVMITDELVTAVQHGRKIIVLSERRKHLEILSEMFIARELQGVTSGFYVGGMKKNDLKKSEGCNVLFSTYQMAKEALDIPALDTAFFVTPTGDVEQAVGRIMRPHEDKKEPIITDFIDENVPRFVRLWNQRRRFYVSEGMFDG